MLLHLQANISKCKLIRNQDLSDQLEKFWAIENNFQFRNSRLIENDPAETSAEIQEMAFRTRLLKNCAANGYF